MYIHTSLPSFCLLSNPPCLNYGTGYHIKFLTRSEVYTLDILILIKLVAGWRVKPPSTH